jgi:hypothetical protein
MVESPMIPITKPTIGEAEVAAAADALRSGWVSQGPRVAEFEQAFAAYVGADHACAVSSCTAALHLALMAVGVKPGDEVITVSHSFIATANCIRYCGALPVFVDIESETFQSRPGAHRIRDHRTHERDPLRASSRHAMRYGAHHADRGQPWTPGDRRCGLRHRQRDPRRRDPGADRKAAWGYRLFLLPSPARSSRPARAAC